MQKFKCHMCRGENGLVRATNSQIRFQCYGHEKNIMECFDCGLVQLSPPWTDDEINLLYEKYSLKSDFPNYKPKIEIRKYIDRVIKGKKRILEIGCGLGHNLRRQIERGYNIIGIDKDPTVCDGKTILNYDINNYVKDETYDLIYSIHVLEHIKNPDSFVNIIRQHLVDGGDFLIEIPSIRDPLLSIYNNRAYQHFYWYPFHLYYYSPETVGSLFEKRGFKVEIKLLQRYGLFNHLRWIFFGKPGNWNPHVFLLDTVYKWFLTRILKKSDTMLIRGRK